MEEKARGHTLTRAGVNIAAVPRLETPILISKPEVLHNNDKAIITVYVANLEKKILQANFIRVYKRLITKLVNLIILITNLSSLSLASSEFSYKSFPSPSNLSVVDYNKKDNPKCSRESIPYGLFHPTLQSNTLLARGQVEKVFSCHLSGEGGERGQEESNDSKGLRVLSVGTRRCLGLFLHLITKLKKYSYYYLVNKNKFNLYYLNKLSYYDTSRPMGKVRLGGQGRSVEDNAPLSLDIKRAKADQLQRSKTQLLGLSLALTRQVNRQSPQSKYSSRNPKTNLNEHITDTRLLTALPFVYDTLQGRERGGEGDRLNQLDNDIATQLLLSLDDRRLASHISNVRYKLLRGLAFHTAGCEGNRQTKEYNIVNMKSFTNVPDLFTKALRKTATPPVTFSSQSQIQPLRLTQSVREGGDRGKVASQLTSVSETGCLGFGCCLDKTRQDKRRSDYRLHRNTGESLQSNTRSERLGSQKKERGYPVTLSNVVPYGRVERRRFGVGTIKSALSKSKIWKRALGQYIFKDMKSLINRSSLGIVYTYTYSPMENGHSFERLDNATLALLANGPYGNADQIINNLEFKNIGGIKYQVKGRLTKRYRADRALIKML